MRGGSRGVNTERLMNNPTVFARFERRIFTCFLGFEEDNWGTLTKVRRPTRRSVYTQAKQKEPPSGPSSIPLKPGPGNRIEYFLQCERDSNANKFSQFVDPGLNNSPNKEAVMESLKYAELQRRYTSMHQESRVNLFT